MNMPDEREPALSRSLRRQLARELPRGWEHEGVCAQADPEAWFPEVGFFASRQVLDTCAGCPVRRSCLAAALLRSEYGVWAGTTEMERRQGRQMLRAGVPVESVLALLLASPLTRTRGYDAPETAPEPGEQVA